MTQLICGVDVSSTTLEARIGPDGRLSFVNDAYCRYYGQPRESLLGRSFNEFTGTMPEDRVWLDNTGRPISDQARITERFHRLDNDTLEWSETIDDPKIYTRPWDTMKLRMTLQDSRIDLMTRYCSPVEIDNYNKTFGDAAGAN